MKLRCSGWPRWPWPWVVLLSGALPVAGQTATWTLEEALARAREQGAGVALARGRLAEAEAREAQAGRRFQENPVLEVTGGHRRAADDDYFDFDASVTQDLEAGGLRAARRAGARAAVEQARAELDEAGRQLVREVAAAFLRALAAEERTALLARSRQAADALLAATERRYEAGEATALALNRARTTAAAARAEQAAAAAAGSEALGELAGLLGLAPGAAAGDGGGDGADLGIPASTRAETSSAPTPEMAPLEVRGSLAAGEPPALAELLAGLDRRPDLAILAAELRAAEAEIALGRALARPAVGVRGGVGREEGAELVTAGLVLALPIHDRGQAELAAGQARADALRRALAATRAAAESEVRGRHAALPHGSRRCASWRPPRCPPWTTTSRSPRRASKPARSTSASCS